jgi:F-type H+-transporting ATPase subunit alpha
MITNEIMKSATLEESEVIESYDTLEITNVGEILSVKDGVAFVSGLENMRVGEMVEFINKQTFGMALNLEREQVGIIVFGDDSAINQGDSVRGLGKLVDIEVGEHLLGHVVDGLGQIIDTETPKDSTTTYETKNIERKAPGVITRLSVTEPLLTGYKIVDSMLPIGRGSVSLSLVIVDW